MEMATVLGWRRGGSGEEAKVLLTMEATGLLEALKTTMERTWSLRWRRGMSVKAWRELCDGEDDEIVELRGRRWRDQRRRSSKNGAEEL